MPARSTRDATGPGAGTGSLDNYFHDLQGPGLHGVMGMYMDDWASGFTVTGNIFYRAGRATLIGGGRDNIVENNLYVECTPSIHLDARGLSWASYYFDGTYPHAVRRAQGGPSRPAAVHHALSRSRHRFPDRRSSSP